MAAMSPREGADAGGCHAWPLPLDGSCASVARQLFRETTAAMGFPSELVHDGMTMASELAANTLHAQGNVEFDSSRRRPVTGAPELWLYVRGLGADAELICKVFDSQRGWKSGAPPDPATADPESVRGRGLQVVAALSEGRWGHHLTRARLGRWKIQGKAVWFALPVPGARVPGELPAGWDGYAQSLTSCQAGKEVEAAIASRGIGNRLVRSEEPTADISVLSVCHGLTVWFRNGLAAWTVPAQGYGQWPSSDLVEVTEQVVRAHEELDTAAAASVG